MRVEDSPSVGSLKPSLRSHCADHLKTGWTAWNFLEDFFFPNHNWINVVQRNCGNYNTCSILWIFWGRCQLLRMPSSVRIVKLLVPWEDDMDDRSAGAKFVNPWNSDKLQGTHFFKSHIRVFPKIGENSKIMVKIMDDLRVPLLVETPIWAYSNFLVLPFTFAYFLCNFSECVFHANIALPRCSCFFQRQWCWSSCWSHHSWQSWTADSGMVGNGKYPHPSFTRSAGYMGDV